MVNTIPARQLINKLREFQTHCPQISEINISYHPEAGILIRFFDNGLEALYILQAKSLIVDLCEFDDTPISEINNILEQCRKLSPSQLWRQLYQYDQGEKRWKRHPQNC